MNLTNVADFLRRFEQRYKHFSFFGAGVALSTFVLGAILAALIIQSEIIPRALQKIDARLNPEVKTDTVAYSWRTVETGLHTLNISDAIPIGAVDPAGAGGGIAEANGSILFATPQGRLGSFRLADNKIDYFDLRVPMNVQTFMDSRYWMRPRYNPNFFRVHDILIVESDAAPATLYVSHHYYQDDCIYLAVSRTEIDLSSDVPRFPDSQWERFVTIDPCIHLPTLEENGWPYSGNMTGGRMIQYDDASILMGVGGFAWEYGESLRAKGENVDFAKVLQIDLETGSRTVFAEGLRNAQGLTLDSSGRLWETESGPQGGDELNLVLPGQHYGFPTVSVGMDYAAFGLPRTPIDTNPVQGRHEGYESPRHAWMPSVAPSNLIAVDTENAFELWENDLIVSTLRGHALYRIRLEGDEVMYTEKIDLGRRLRDIIQLSTGELAIWDNYNHLIFIRDDDALIQNAIDAETISVSGYEKIRSMEAEVASANAAVWGATQYSVHCAGCHSLDDTPASGPTLAGLFDRPAGGLEGYPYSPDLAAAGGRWTTERVAKFAMDPQSISSNTIMPAIQIGKWEAEAIAEYIKSNPVQNTDE